MMVKAIKLLGVYTAGRFDIWLLAGSSKASCRSHVMSELRGVKVPQSKAGVNAMRDALWPLNPNDNPRECIAARQESFVEWARTV